MLARDVMTAPVVTINARARIHELTKLLSERSISGVPVCDDSGRVVGMVSSADLLNMKGGQTVSDIMNREVISVTADTPVEQVAAVLSQNKIKRVPVFEGEKLVGIISRSDIVAAMAKMKCTLL